MKIDKFHDVLKFFSTLFIVVSCLEDAEFQFRKLKFSRKEAKACIAGKVVVKGNGTYSANDEFKLLECTTTSPKCGFTVTSTSPPRLRNSDDDRMSEIDFGCFPARLLHDRIMEVREKTVVFPADNFLEIFKYWYNEKRFLIEYFRKYRPTVDSDPEGRREHENEWVENPPHDVFHKREILEEEAFMGMEMTAGTRAITPIIMFYILFICFSVLIKLIWLAKLAYRTAQLGYVPLAKTDYEDGDQTFEEME